MVFQPIVGNPKVTAQRVSTHRIVLKSDQGVAFLPEGKTIDGALSRDPLNTGDLDVLRAGMLMGKITASNKYAPSVLGLTTNAEAASSVSIEVSAATAVELVRRLGTTGTFNLTGPPTAGGTVITEVVTYTAVNTTTGVITVDAITAAFVANSLVQPVDGSEDFVTVVGDGNGINVTDENRDDVDVQFAHTQGGPAFLLAGIVDPANILNFSPLDSALQTFVKGKLNGGDGTQSLGAPFIFDDRF